MTTNSGDTAGYFFAVFFLVTGLPALLICTRMFRRAVWGSDLFEIRYAECAKRHLFNHRWDIVQHRFRASQNNLRNRSLRVMQETASTARASISNIIPNADVDRTAVVDSAVIDELSLMRGYKDALRNGTVYWGIKRAQIENGLIIMNRGDPPGLLEDLIFSACNNVQPLPFAFGDKDHPETIFSRFVSYCTAQTFVIWIYLTVPNPTLRQIISWLLAPIIMVVELWLRYLLVCPCLADDDDSISDTPSEGDSQARLRRHTLRVIGAFLAIPILVILIILFVGIAESLNAGVIPDISLARFLWDGIMFPFLLKLILFSVKYFWFIFPTHINICGFTLIYVNQWVEEQLYEKDLRARLSLSEQELETHDKAMKTKVHGESNCCFLSCHYLRCSGLDEDNHQDLDLCRPQCYCWRFSNKISDWYWEEAPLHTRHVEIETLLQSQQHALEASIPQEHFEGIIPPLVPIGQTDEQADFEMATRLAEKSVYREDLII